MTFTDIMDKGFLLYYLEGVEVQHIAVIYTLMILGVLVCIAAPYFLGSLKFSALPRFTGDALKVLLSAPIGYIVLGEMGAYIAGFMCIVGHVYPIYYRFKGEDRVLLTTAIVILVLDPVIFLILLAVFAIIVLMTKYISLGTVMCMMLYPVILNRIRGPGFSNIIAIMIAVFIIFLHRENIKRLTEGKETKISLGRKKKKDTVQHVEEVIEDEEPQSPEAGKFNKNTSKKKHKNRQRK